MKLFKPELIDLAVQATSVDDFFTQKATVLAAKDFVQESFLAAIQQREKEFPTGLALAGINIAIPHTDVIHIKEPFIAINRLGNPLMFMQMGTDDVEVETSDVFVLGIKDPKKQVGLLSALMDIFANPEFVNAYQKAATTDEIIELFTKY